MPSFVPYTGSEDARFVHNRDDRLGEISQQRERVVGKDSQIPSGTDESACPGEHERRRRYIKIRNTFKILLNPTLIYIYICVAKSGIDPEAAISLYEHILRSCANLQLEGLMTIGKYGHDYSTGPNMDLVRMMELHTKLCYNLKLAPDTVQVSMGMSNDYDRAVNYIYI